MADSKEKFIAVRMDIKLLEELKEKAKHMNMTLSDYVRLVLSTYDLNRLNEPSQLARSWRSIRQIYVIVDSNQISKLPNQFSPTKIGGYIEGITLSPYVYAEILFLNNPKPSLSKLSAFNIRLGDEIPTIMDKLSRFTEDDIIRYEPFLVFDTDASFNHFLTTLMNPPQGLVEDAKKIKYDGRTFCERMFNQAQDLRRRVREQGSYKYRYESIEDAMTKHGHGATSFLGDLVVNTISMYGRRKTIISDPELLYSTVMRNPYLGRLFKTILCYVLSYSRVWKDPKYNFDPQGNIDDWTDMTLPLYAGHGDLILTEDKKLRSAIAMVEPSGKITAKPMNELK